MHDVNLYEEKSRESVLEDFILKYRPLVKKIALHLKRKLPSHIELEDLLQSGFVGLLEARDNYQSDKGASFETFAGIRIHGAMIDSLRKNSWCNREAIKNMRLIASAISKIEQRTQQAATAEDIVSELGITTDEYLTICQQVSICNVLSLDAMNLENYLLARETENPFEITQREEMQQVIKKMLLTLPERDQQILSLYYIDEFNFKQIGQILDLTEARICQLHSQAILRIQNKLRSGSC